MLNFLNIFLIFSTMMAHSSALADWEITSSYHFFKGRHLYNGRSNPNYYAWNYIESLRNSDITIPGSTDGHLEIVGENFVWHLFLNTDNFDLESIVREFDEPSRGEPCPFYLGKYYHGNTYPAYAYIRTSLKGRALEATSCFVYENYSVELPGNGPNKIYEDIEVESFKFGEIIFGQLFGTAYLGNW